MFKKLLIGLSLLTSQACWAADTYNPATNQLSITSVDVSGTTYTDVLITVGNVLSVGGGDPKGSFDSYNASLNQLSIPSVTVNGMTYNNVVVTVGQVLSVGSQVASSLIFPLHDLKNASYLVASVKPFTVSGQIGHGNIITSGTGTNDDSMISAGFFELNKARQRKTTVIGTYFTALAPYVPVPLNSCNTSWIDDHYEPLGNTCGTDYIVVDHSTPLPVAAHIGDSCTWYTAKRYTDSLKNTLSGMRLVKFSLISDEASSSSANNAIFRITTEDRISLQSDPHLILETYIRVSTTGEYTRIKETINRPSTSVYIVKTF